MFRKIAIAGATAAVIVGAGTAAIAATGSSSSGTPSTGTTGSSSTSSSTPAKADGSKLGKFAKRHPGVAALIEHHAVHGQIVTTDGKGNYVTHDGILGSVSAVSSTSITIKSGDGFVQTYTVNSGTKVRDKSDGKSATIGQVKVGDKVGVVGTGTSASPVATYVIDGE
jgi:hypothetical protein